MKFQGMVALVTGAAGDIGYCIAKDFAQEGATVILNDIDLAAAQQATQRIERDGFLAMAYKADVSRSTEVEAMVNQVMKDHDQIDILVNNAAVFAESVTVIEIEEEDWDKVLNVNLKGVFICSKVVGRHMIKRRSGKIINITSFTGKTGRVVYSTFGNPTKAHYCASKAGIISLTKSLAFELASYNINVNAVAAGSIATATTHEGKKQMITPLIPLGRMGTPEDVAAAVLFLASPEASFITGEILDVNGGTLMD